MTTAADVVSNKQVASVVTAAVKPIYRRYRKFVSWDDLSQELWLWLCANPARAMELLDESEAYLLRRLRTVAERYARKEKAVKSGYDPDDEAAYSLDRIAELLPDALDPAATSPQSGLTETPTARSEQFLEWETGVVDVRRGLERISSPLYATLTAHHVQGRDVDPADYRDALKAVQRALGGPRPRVPADR